MNALAGKHPGFKAVQGKIAKKYGMKAAGAILASSTRKASSKAKTNNPRLKKVKMAKPSSYENGGMVQQTGMAKVHKGETVVPANKPKPFVPFGGEPIKDRPTPKESRDEINAIRKNDNRKTNFQTQGITKRSI